MNAHNKEKIASFFHTWIGTISAVLGIIVWLTGLQSIYDIGRPGALNTALAGWGQPPVSVTIALILLSNGFVWAAYFIIATTIFTKTKNNLLISSPTKIVVWVIAFSIGIIIFDIFFDIRALLTSDDMITLLFFGFILVIAIPMAIVGGSDEIAEEYGCENCGKITLEDISTNDTDTTQERSRITIDEKSYTRIKTYQNYVVKRQCKNCKSKWIYNKKRLLDTLDTPEN